MTEWLVGVWQLAEIDPPQEVMHINQWQRKEDEVIKNWKCQKDKIFGGLGVDRGNGK